MMARISQQVKRSGKVIGFIPTMGALHRGHISLAKAARKDTDIVVMSIFVNPAQFGPKEDFKRYPRNFKNDRKLARRAGVDFIFCPNKSKMYPGGFRTYVQVDGLSELLCGESRPGHFRGVVTVVAKLFNIVRPDVAYFGQKDAQQAIIIKRMVEDLNMPIKIKLMPIIRERDGLAMSSRNIYLSKTERDDARVLFQALNLAKRLINQGEKDARGIINSMKRIIGKKKTARIDYLEIVDPDNLMPVRFLKREALVTLAVWIGRTRLIDNIIVKN